MSFWKNSVKELRKEVQSYYDGYQRAQTAVERAQLDLEEAQREERTVRAKNREKIYVELAAHNTKAKRLILQAKKDELRRYEESRFSLLRKSKEIREELSRQIDDAFTVNPADVDANVMTLIRSGVLKVADYEKLYADAEKSHNVTMMRLLGKTCGDLAGKETDAETRRMLNSIYATSISGKQNELQHYDEYAFAVSRGTGDPQSVYNHGGNPYMFEYFLDNTADIDGADSGSEG